MSRSRWRGIEYLKGSGPWLRGRLRFSDRARTSRGLAAVALAVAVGCGGVSCASRAGGDGAGMADPDKAPRRAADALLGRPVSLVATLAGGVVWLVSLPFHALAGNSDEAARALIGEPGAYTFTRPLGDFRRCVQYGADPCVAP
jgi:hypothetical protein